MKPIIVACLVAVMSIAYPASGDNEAAEGTGTGASDLPVDQPIVSAADRIVESLTNSTLRALVEETLERNPSLARAAARSRAAELRAPQVRALPDPIAGATAWIAGPETRTGPQLLTLSWSQPIPWLSKLDLGERHALLEAAATRLELEAMRLELLTKVRRVYYELAFEARQREITYDLLDHLRQHEAISRSRYATGAGVSQDVVKIQAEITRAENHLLAIDQRRIELEAQLNELRDRSASTLILPAALPRGEEVDVEFPTLRRRAEESRPEVKAADLRIAATEVKIDLAQKSYRPDFNVGLTYTFVDRRNDEAGILNPPEGNGGDILGIQGGVRIPLWNQRLKSGVEEASQLELAARESRRAVMAQIETALGDLLQRIPLTWKQLRLLDDILLIQARESVRSAQANYVSGTYNALDLLDAEHVLFDAETAIARARADYAIRLAHLEGVVAEPLAQIETTRESDG